MATTEERQQLSEYARNCGRAVKFRRMAMGMLQEQLAERLDVKQSTVARWEAGLALPRDYHRGRLAFELDRDVIELFPPVGRIAPMARAAEGVA